MSMLAAFIGVDKHRDSRIRDLSGARRDATALWALFEDTVPALKAELITDDRATVEAVQRALDRTLGAAGQEDAVVFSFSGHGTHDHRLVMHDTVPDSLATTTIGMADLASRFKATKARAVLCILDCCFSGGAPARVLEDSPIPRDVGNPLQELSGKGRVLIAASNLNEPAWEIPGGGHGLLTQALLEVFQGSADTVSLPTAMDQVLERVRIAASRIGVQQTPILLGYIEGGLILPALRAGERFRAEFPDLRDIRVSATVGDLKEFGLPQDVLTEWQARLGDRLNDLQLQAINEERILDGSSLLVVAPTSSGKTFIGEMAAVRAVLSGRKAVFLLPYRALVNEKYDQFSELYGDRLGFRVLRCTGDYRDRVQDFVRGKYDLALLTYEMFLSLAVANPVLLSQVGLVVVDETQFITDPQRGISVELLLTHIIAAREKGISPQIIALSATIGSINKFDDWLSSGVLVSAARPVPLVEGVLDRDGVYQCLDASGRAQTMQLLPAYSIRIRRDKPSSQDVIVPLVRQLMQAGETVLVFRNNRGSAQGCAVYLARELGLPPATDALSALPSHDLSSTSNDLRQCLSGGTAFHTSDLSREERLIVERAFRSSDGTVRALAATTTVAAGINTPASTVILAEQEFLGEDGRPFTIAEYKNMAGRAGRLGFRNEGRSVVLANTPFERDALFRKYVIGQLEPLRSSFDPQHLETWIVRLLAQVQRIARANVIRLLTNTYGGYLLVAGNPQWREHFEPRLEALLSRMITLGLVEEEGDKVQLTLLGRACGRSALSFESAMRLVEMLRGLHPQALSAESLMVLVQALPESDGGYTPMMKRGRAESVWPRLVGDRYGHDLVRSLQRYANDEWDYFARCKRAAILSDWIAGVPIEGIERRYTVNPIQGRIRAGDVRRFADATRFHLGSAHQIASVLLVAAGPNETDVEALLRQLEVGIPRDALSLLEIPINMGRGEYLALHRAGLKTAVDVWLAPKSKLQEVLSP